jgi:hypothetical protein
LDCDIHSVPFRCSEPDVAYGIIRVALGTPGVALGTIGKVCFAAVSGGRAPIPRPTRWSNSGRALAKELRSHLYFPSVKVFLTVECPSAYEKSYPDSSSKALLRGVLRAGNGSGRFPFDFLQQGSLVGRDFGKTKPTARFWQNEANEVCKAESRERLRRDDGETKLSP